MTISINVYVKDAADDSAISSASVTITDPMNTVTNGSTTNSSGYSSNTMSVLAGSSVYKVKVAKSGKTTAEFEVSGQAGSTKTVWVEDDIALRITLKVVDALAGTAISGALVTVSSTDEDGPTPIIGNTNTSGEISPTVAKNCDTYKIEIEHPNYQTLRIDAVSTSTTFEPKLFKLTKKAYDTYGGTPPP